MTSLDELVRPDRYPRASRYDPAWLLRLDMGPNPLWLLENLALVSFSRSRWWLRASKGRR